MKFLKKNDIGFDFIISKYIRFFTEFNCWFLYFNLPKYTIRFSNAGNYIFKKEE